MRHVAVCLAVVLAAGAAANAQNLPPDAAAAYAVGEASAHLRQASPCFPNSDLGRQLNAMMAAALERVSARPDHAAAFERGMILTGHQQRFIPRSDPTACNGIVRALQHYLQMPVD